MNVPDRINQLDDHTREGIALLLKGIELIVRIAFSVAQVRLFVNAWKSDAEQKRRIKRMFALAFFAGMLSFTGKLFKDLKRKPENFQVPSWAREFYNSLDIKRST